MDSVDFGLMMRLTQPERAMSEVYEYNLQCIHALSPVFTTLWFEDHLQWEETGVLECLTSLSFFAAAFPKYRVGTLVVDQSYRNPALLAKMAANLQFLSEGRLILGLGAGWKEDEYRAYGYPFPTVKARLEQLEETLLVIRAMWSAQPATYVGTYHEIQDAYCKPEPSPAIPLLLGGGGEQRMLGLVARYADWWNYNSCPVEEYAHKVAVLKDHCERVGRDIQEIRLTYLSTLSVAEDPSKVIRHPQKHYIAGNASEVIRELEQFREIGVTHFIFRIPDLAALEYFGENIAPHFAR